MQQKVAITGSSGRIGRALHWKLSREHAVNGLDLAPSSVTNALGDIRDYVFLMRNFEGAETIFHTAALHAPHVGIATEHDFYDINVHATELLCKAALAHGVSRIVFTSTTALYGHANQEEGRAAWINETTVPKPRTIYHRSKLDAENILKDYSGEALQVSVIRMSRCFPEPAPVMAVYRLHRGVDYRDVAEAHLLAATSARPEKYDVFVISGGTPFEASDCQQLYENPETVIRDKCPDLALEFDKRGWPFPACIDRVYDSSYATQRQGWKAIRGPLELLKQYDDMDFEVLPPAPL